MIGKLGKLPPVRDPRTLRLGRYLVPPQLPTPPEVFDRSHVVPIWGMMANDAVGDCTCATVGHLIMGWTAVEGHPVVPSDADVLAMYSRISGYDPRDPATDIGATCLDVLNDWRKIGMNGDRLGAYALVDEQDPAMVRTACALFEGLYLGIALPRSAQDQGVWDYDPQAPASWRRPGSWGGHAVPAVGYDPDGVTVVTWGRCQRLTWPFWSRYVEECYVGLSPDYVGTDGVGPTGIRWAELAADLAAITA